MVLAAVGISRTRGTRSSTTSCDRGQVVLEWTQRDGPWPRKRRRQRPSRRRAADDDHSAISRQVCRKRIRPRQRTSPPGAGEWQLIVRGGASAAEVRWPCRRDSEVQVDVSSAAPCRSAPHPRPFGDCMGHCSGIDARRPQTRLPSIDVTDRQPGERQPSDRVLFDRLHPAPSIARRRRRATPGV